MSSLETKSTQKNENLQKIGSFKIRGALNKVATLTEEENSHGVIASSAGSHAQGRGFRCNAAESSHSGNAGRCTLAKVMATPRIRRRG